METNTIEPVAVKTPKRARRLPQKTADLLQVAKLASTKWKQQPNLTFTWTTADALQKLCTDCEGVYLNKRVTSFLYQVR